jgi:hypothetical protein
MARKLAPVRLAVHLPLKFRCGEDWRAMTPVAGGRACGACDRVVHDLSAMSEREAARFMAEKRGTGVCLRYEAYADGTVVYRQAPPRLAPALMVAALAACAPHEPLPRISGEPEVGAQAVPPSAAVVVPEAVPVVPVVPVAPPAIEPPDDDINPCPGPAHPEPDDAKKAKKPKKGEEPARRPVEFLGIEG